MVESKKEQSTTDQNQQDTDKAETRVMWIMTAAIMLGILGLMGWNMLTHPDWIHALLSINLLSQSLCRVSA